MTYTIEINTKSHYQHMTGYVDNVLHEGYISVIDSNGKVIWTLSSEIKRLNKEDAIEDAKELKYQTEQQNKVA